MDLHFGSVRGVGNSLLREYTKGSVYLHHNSYQAVDEWGQYLRSRVDIGVSTHQGT